jgi:CBS domain containing-hemolysin-like protein
MKNEEPPGATSNLVQNHSKNNNGFLGKMTHKLRGLFRNNNSSLQESVAELIEEHEESDGQTMSSEERTILQNVLRFGEITVQDIMIPRTDIVAVEHGISLSDLKTILIEQEHTRMPVYRESLDNVIGFIHIKDLIPIITNTKPFVIENIIRKLLVISPNMKLIDLLVKMRQSRMHMALVLDEYGGTDGLVTIEDVVEEIIGEIQDEHDDEEIDFVRLNDNTIEASARLPISELEEIVKIQIPLEDEEIETVGGLILSVMGYVPVKGEQLVHPTGIEFEIIDSDPRKINTVRIKWGV